MPETPAWPRRWRAAEVGGVRPRTARARGTSAGRQPGGAGAGRRTAGRDLRALPSGQPSPALLRDTGPAHEGACGAGRRAPRRPRRLSLPGGRPPGVPRPLVADAGGSPAAGDGAPLAGRRGGAVADRADRRPATPVLPDFFGVDWTNPWVITRRSTAAGWGRGRGPDRACWRSVTGRASEP